MSYEHCFDVTLAVLVHVSSPDRSRKKVTRQEIYDRLVEIISKWDADDVEAHIEGNIDYLESNVVLTESEEEARAGIISEGDYFDSDEETG